MTDKRSTMPSDFAGLDTGSAEGKNCSRHLSTTATLESGTHQPCRLWQVTPRKRHPACNACRGACFFSPREGWFQFWSPGSTRPSKEPEKKEKSLKSKQIPQEIEGMCEVWWVLMLLSLVYLCWVAFLDRVSEERLVILMHFICSKAQGGLHEANAMPACFLCSFFVPWWYLHVDSALPVRLCQEWSTRCHAGDVRLASLTNLECYIELLLMVDAPLFRWYLMYEVSAFLLLEHIQIGNQLRKVTCIHIGMQETDWVAFRLHIYRSSPLDGTMMMPCQDQRSHTVAKKEWDSSPVSRGKCEICKGSSDWWVVDTIRYPNFHTWTCLEGSPTARSSDGGARGFGKGWNSTVWEPSELKRVCFQNCRGLRFQHARVPWSLGWFVWTQFGMEASADRYARGSILEPVGGWPWRGTRVCVRSAKGAMVKRDNDKEDKGGGDQGEWWRWWRRQQQQ